MKGLIILSPPRVSNHRLQSPFLSRPIPWLRSQTVTSRSHYSLSVGGRRGVCVGSRAEDILYSVRAHKTGMHFRVKIEKTTSHGSMLTVNRWPRQVLKKNGFWASKKITSK